MQRFAVEFADLLLVAVKLDDVSKAIPCETAGDTVNESKQVCSMDVDAVNALKEDPLLLEEQRCDCDRLTRPSRFSYMLRKHFLSPNTDVIFGRQSYFQLLQLIIQRVASRYSGERNCRMLVTGTPGVGKSAFGWVVLKYYLHAEKFNTIIVDFISFQVMYHRSDRNHPWTVSTFNEGSIPRAAHDSSTLLLYDCRKGHPSPPIVDATTVAFSSPNREHYTSIEKNNCLFYLLPLWDLDELLFVGQLINGYLSDEVICANFAVAGGVPRTVFHPHPDEVRLSVDNAIGNQTRLDTLSSLCGTQILDPKFEPITHKLLHFHVHPGFLSFHVAFASPYVCEKVLSKLGDNQDQQCQLWLHDHTDAMYAAMRGQIFEAYVLRLLAQPSGPFKIKCLESKSPDVGPFGAVRQSDGTYSMVHFTAPHPTCKFKKLVDAKPDHLNIPTAKNRAAIDALFSLLILLQITVSLDHGLKHKYVLEILNELKLDAPFIVFVVPSDKFDAFQKQSYLNDEGHLHQRLGKVGECIQFAFSVPLGS